MTGQSSIESVSGPTGQLALCPGHCSSRTAFIYNTYIYPGGMHGDGTPLSEQERQEVAQIATMIDSVTDQVACHNRSLAERKVKPFRLNGWKGWMVGLLCLFSGVGETRGAVCNRRVCHEVIGNSRSAVTWHSVCRPVSDQHPLSGEFAKIDNSSLRRLSSEIPSSRQREIIANYRSMRFDRNNQHDSRVSLILSGGTRPTAQLTRENHQAYARFRGINYRFVYPLEFRDELGSKQLYWMKIFALKNALECENQPSGQWVVWLDDDIVIDDFSGSVSMLDQYINHFGHADFLVAGDNKWARVNTGILLVRKTEKARSFLHMWSLFSNDPVMGYQPQKHTLHEQEALRILIESSLFNMLVKRLNLIGIVPNRDETKGLNLNTYQREEFVKAQPWYDKKLQIPGVAEEDRQGYQCGDSFIHHGTPQFRTRLIEASLRQVIEHYRKDLERNNTSVILQVLYQCYEFLFRS